MSAPVVNGVHGDISDNDYHADPLSLSSSGARALLPPSCPAKFKHKRDNPPPPKAEYDFGHLAHRLVLGKGAEIEVIAADDWRTKVAQEARSVARDEGKVPVLQKDMDRAQVMAATVYDHPTAGDLFMAPNGHAEVSIYADDPDTGVQLRARPDWSYVADDRLIIVDYKTTVTAYPSQFERRAAEYGYHCQAAWYIDVAILAGLCTSPAFLLVAQEKEAPYLVSVLEFEPDDIAEGRRRNREAINLYKRCVERDEWPGCADGIVPINLPPWMKSSSEPTINDLVSPE